MTQQRQIGDKVWHRGDQVVISTLPYEYCGGMFQDATTEDGKTVVLATPEQVEKTTQEHRQAWRSEQAGFRRLKEQAR